MLQAGRMVFGFGGESLGVAQGTLVASWFKNSELGELIIASLHCEPHIFT